MNAKYTHGGNLVQLARESGRAPADILDFSVNVRPEGVPDFIAEAFRQTSDQLSPYPSPHAEDAREVMSRALNIPDDCLILGNGSNELIHSLPRAFSLKKVMIVEPAFSEYRLACERFGSVISSLTGTKERGFLPELAELEQNAPAQGAVFLANPGNPAGTLWDTDELLGVINRRTDVLWIVDEAFIDYAGEEHSLLQDSCTLPHLIVLRSLTKFYGMAGVRAGYAAGHPSLIQKLQAEIPSWNLNTFAIAAIKAIFENRHAFLPREDGGPDFHSENRKNNDLRRSDLEKHLRGIKGLIPLPSAANYILFQWPFAPADLAMRCAKEHGIALRDCSNYHGLEHGDWYRVAVAQDSVVEEPGEAFNSSL